jgi:hypothetical protein
MIKGRQVVAKTHIPLQTGRTFSLITDSISPVLSFRPLKSLDLNTQVPKIPLVLSATKENLWLSILGKMSGIIHHEEPLSQLRNLIQEMILGPTTRISPEFIRVFIEKSGLVWESKLKKAFQRESVRPEDITRLLGEDVKGLASKLYVLENRPKPLEQFISALKHIQLANTIYQGEDKTVFLPIPLLLPDDATSLARLLIRMPVKHREAGGKQDTDTRPMRISIQVELSQLGQIYGDICLDGKAVTARFLLSKPETRTLVQRQIPHFADRLRENDFYPKQMICFLEDAVSIEKSFTSDFLQVEDGTLNVVI